MSNNQLLSLVVAVLGLVGLQTYLILRVVSLTVSKAVADLRLDLQREIGGIRADNQLLAQKFDDHIASHPVA